MKKNWMKYRLWLSVFALIGLILNTWGLFEHIGLTNESYTELVNSIMVVLVGAGFINPPETKEKQQE